MKMMRKDVNYLLVKKMRYIGETIEKINRKLFVVTLYSKLILIYIRLIRFLKFIIKNFLQLDTSSMYLLLYYKPMVDR